jgi:hypothetical protein
MRTLSESLREYIAAAFPGLWVQSHEHDEALREIAELAKRENWQLAVWDIDRGLQIAGGIAPGAADPLAALRAVKSLSNTKSSALLVLPNFHKFLNSPEIIQCLTHQLQTGKENRTFVVILSPVVQIPIELEHQFVVLEHALPDRRQIQKIAEGVGTSAGDLPEGPELERLLDAAVGLTRNESENAFSLSLVRHEKLVPETIWELKTSTLKKSGLLELHRGTEAFEQLGGLDALKGFCARALGARQRNSRAQPRGILLLGVAGSGKSQFCKALGNQTGRPTLILDVGALMGSLVGQTESNCRRALAIVDAMAPCILMLDEVEKALSGVVSSGQTDSGVSARLFGTFLTWLSDHSSDVFVVCTSNDISKLPPEFSRAERFDGVFFLDLPSTAEKAKIWEIYLQVYQLPAQDLPRTEDWTGAEIKSCCRLAALLDVSLIESAKQVVPVAVTAAESVERLRNWASGRCLSAAVPGLYQRAGTTTTTTGRRVSRAAAN